MTKLTAEPGACGFTCNIEIEKLSKYQVKVHLQSKCGQIKKLSNEVDEIDFMEIYRGPFGQNLISQAAARCKCHPSCPIPCALIKAIEAELGMAVKKDVSFAYEE